MEEKVLHLFPPMYTLQSIAMYEQSPLKSCEDLAEWHIVQIHLGTSKWVGHPRKPSYHKPYLSMVFQNQEDLWTLSFSLKSKDLDPTLGIPTLQTFTWERSLQLSGFENQWDHFPRPTRW